MTASYALTPADFDHESGKSAHLSAMIVMTWSKGTVPSATRLAELLAQQPHDFLQSHDVHTHWHMALTIAKFTARLSGLPIPKGICRP